MTPAEADRLAIATAERDRARTIAVALEQRLARVEALIDNWVRTAEEFNESDFQRGKAITYRTCAGILNHVLSGEADQ